jgi:hypothetical protein
MSEKPNMSPATKELLKKVRMMVPPMLEKFHKGISLNQSIALSTTNSFV